LAINVIYGVIHASKSRCKQHTGDSTPSFQQYRASASTERESQHIRDKQSF
jgi:hypothetical protein